jgi:glutathione S-transferase
MGSEMKPLTLWGGMFGPNPGKVAMLLNELGLSYKLVEVPYTELKGPEFTKINPNGRVPALEDPNTGIRLWESGAIIEYLIEKYDTEHRLSFPKDTPEYFLTKQWLYFQVSGQGPYYGQAW